MSSAENHSGHSPGSALEAPHGDPTPIFEAFRGCHSTELLTAAVAHFDVFTKLAAGELESARLQALSAWPSALSWYWLPR